MAREVHSYEDDSQKSSVGHQEHLLTLKVEQPDLHGIVTGL